MARSEYYFPAERQDIYRRYGLEVPPELEVHDEVSPQEIYTPPRTLDDLRTLYQRGESSDPAFEGYALLVELFARDLRKIAAVACAEEGDETTAIPSTRPIRIKPLDQIPAAGTIGLNFKQEIEYAHHLERNPGERLFAFEETPATRAFVGSLEYFLHTGSPQAYTRSDPNEMMVVQPGRFYDRTRGGTGRDVFLYLAEIAGQDPLLGPYRELVLRSHLPSKATLYIPEPKAELELAHDDSNSQKVKVEFILGDEIFNNRGLRHLIEREDSYYGIHLYCVPKEGRFFVHVVPKGVETGLIFTLETDAEGWRSVYDSPFGYGARFMPGEPFYPKPTPSES